MTEEREAEVAGESDTGFAFTTGTPGTGFPGANAFEIDSPFSTPYKQRSEKRARGGGENDDHVHHDDAGSNDHFALIYEGHEDQFAAVVPFIAQGLEQGERCLYIADENTEEEVLDALVRGGIDVAAALDAGALLVFSKADSYLQDGEFEADSMFEFWQEALAEAKDKNGYEGIRATAEMTWALDAFDDETGLDPLVRYEALLNNLYAGEDYVGLCQYSRTRFSDEVLSDVIRSHPRVVYNGTVCRNLHYHPPDEFLEANRPPLDVGRTIEGLFERAQTRRTLREREWCQRKLYKITSSPNHSFGEKLEALFELGSEYFGMGFGGLARIDPPNDRFEVETINREHSHLIPGKEYPLSETYCRLTATTGGTATVTDPIGQGFEGALCYEQFGIRAYLGTLIELDEGFDRVFFFVSNEPRDEPFSDEKQTFHRLMGQWVEQELRRKQQERDLKELNQTLEERVEKRTRQVRDLTATVTLAEQRERDRIARLLHDGLQQRLYGSQLQISSLRREVEGTGQMDLADRIQNIEGEIEEIRQALRQLSVGMSPPVLEGDGLKGVLEWLQSHMLEAQGLKVHLTAEKEYRVEEEMRVLVFRAAKELLATLVESARAHQATVHLHGEAGEFVIEVAGEGCGFDPEAIAIQESEDGFGLTAVCERLRLFGGELTLKKDAEKGGYAEIRVPMDGNGTNEKKTSR